MQETGFKKEISFSGSDRFPEEVIFTNMSSLSTAQCQGAHPVNLALGV